QQQTAARRQARDGAFQDGQRQPGTQRAAAVAVGALGRIDQIGRVGQYQVELAVDGIEQVAVPRLQVVRRGQRGIHLGQAQRGGVDVHRQYLGLGSRQSGEDGSRTGATANVYGAPDVAPMKIQVRLDGTGETVGVRAEEHR